MKRAASCVVLCVAFISAAIIGGCGGPGKMVLTFTGGNALGIDAGQSITINVTATNDGGQGVTWTCTGPVFDFSGNGSGSRRAVS